MEGHGIDHVDILIFLGVLLGYPVTSAMTLAARTVTATNSFYAYFKIMRESTLPLADRLAMLNRHVTSTWRWMAPAVRPVQEVCSHITRMSTDFLLHMTQFSRDYFVGVSDWVARRRAAKIAAQKSGFVSWARVLWTRYQYLSYGRHAARLPSSNSPPIRMVLGIRNRVEDPLLAVGCPKALNPIPPCGLPLAVAVPVSGRVQGRIAVYMKNWRPKRKNENEMVTGSILWI